MTVDDLIQQQASRNQTPNQDYEPSEPEDSLLFKLYHLNGYVNGPGFRIESVPSESDFTQT